MRSVRDNIRISQIVLISGLIVSTIIAPELFFSYPQGGISNYGTSFATIVPFSVGFLGCSYFLLREVSVLRRSDKTYSKWLVYLSLGYTLTLLSTYPYKLSPTFKSIHFYISSAFILFAICMAVWLLKHTSSKPMQLIAAATFGCGVVLSVMTMLKVIDLLFLSEVLIIGGFGGLLIGYDSGKV